MDWYQVVSDKKFFGLIQRFFFFYWILESECGYVNGVGERHIGLKSEAQNNPSLNLYVLVGSSHIYEQHFSNTNRMDLPGLEKKGLNGKTLLGSFWFGGICISSR